jgi:hypothetical protein
MILLTLSCSLEEQVTLRQAATRRHGDAIPACKYEGQIEAPIRGSASSQWIAEDA